jgi:NitT/TauT family transport system ATP-binding protein
MPQIELSEVEKAFESQKGATTCALNDVSIRIDRGEVACLVGPSGCGKTTILNLIAGFDSPTSGTVRVDGRPVTGAGADRVVIFQDVHGSLMPWWTAGQNVEFGLRIGKKLNARERRELARRYLELVDLDHAIDKFPEEMSGGMQQRVQIARALVTEPEVLLMDEPFGALDFLTRSRLQLLLQDLHVKKPTTTVFVTHDITEAAVLGDSIWVMDSNGRIHERLEVDAPRPRSMTTPTVVEAIEKLMTLVLPEDVHGSESPAHGSARSLALVRK